VTGLDAASNLPWITRPYTSYTQRKETTILVVLTLGAGCARTLEQVHGAVKTALDAVVVQGRARLRAGVAAAATGDLHQCLAQGLHIDSVRRRAWTGRVPGDGEPTRLGLWGQRGSPRESGEIPGKQAGWNDEM